MEFIWEGEDDSVIEDVKKFEEKQEEIIEDSNECEILNENEFEKFRSFNSDFFSKKMKVQSFFLY